jgi:hypothetical protein
MTNKMDPFDQTKKKKTAGPKYQNFIEAFKDIGGSKGPSPRTADASTQSKPATNAQLEQNFDFQEYLKLREKKIQQQERTRFEAIRREEKIIFSREQQQTKLQIETLQTQIKDLAKEQIGLMKEVEKASFQSVVNPGTYHQNFFERLLSLIKLAKKKIVESKTWLQLHNQRAQKRSAYWQGCKKSGTSFMLSGERTVATQTG